MYLGSEEVGDNRDSIKIYVKVLYTNDVFGYINNERATGSDIGEKLDINQADSMYEIKLFEMYGDEAESYTLVFKRDTSYSNKDDLRGYYWTETYKTNK